MTAETIFLVALFALTLFNNGVQAYIHFEAYPLFAAVGKAEFDGYLREYERRLTIPLLLPYGLTLLSNLALLFVRSESLPIIGVLAALVLNISVAAITMSVATPVYNRIKAAQQAGSADLHRLMQINLLRLLISTASSLAVIGLVLAALAR